MHWGQYSDILLSQYMLSIEMEVKELYSYLTASYYNILYTYKWPNGLGNASKVLVWQVL